MDSPENATAPRFANAYESTNSRRRMDSSASNASNLGDNSESVVHTGDGQRGAGTDSDRADDDNLGREVLPTTHSVHATQQEEISATELEDGSHNPLGNESVQSDLGDERYSSSQPLDLEQTITREALSPNALTASTFRSEGSVNRSLAGLNPSNRNNFLVLPQWQPDSEVTNCPICKTPFTFWYRKHHCRKCGRVVCSRCSPHRITIPRQFIVRPPEDVALDAAWRNLTGIPDETDEDIDADPTHADPASQGRLPNPALGGGAEVRICNPCVPDPNYNLPSTLNYANFSTPRYNEAAPRRPIPRYESSGSSLPATTVRLGHRPSQSASAAPAFRPIADGTRDRSATFSHRHSRLNSVSGSGQRPQIYFNPNDLSVQQLQSLSNVEQLRSDLPQFDTPLFRRTQFGVDGHNNAFADHSGLPRGRSGPSAPALRPVYRSMIDVGSVHPSQHLRRQPLREEDECPICHLELPPIGEDGSSGEREQHINDCVDRAFSGGTPSRPHSAAPAGETFANERNDDAGPSTYSAFSRPKAMLTYRATEKDCIGSNGEPQECVICFEEFAVGDELGRLECLCKFHRLCIRQWCEKKGPGSCPVHQVQI